MGTIAQMPINLESLSPELLDNILIYLTTQHDLNSLSQTSTSLYHHTIPSLYRKWSFHGLQQELKPLRKFLETINWRPDLAVHVKELDIREWGNCPRLEDNYGEDPGENYRKRIKAEEEARKESEKDTLMNDEIFGEGNEESDGTYEDSDDSDDSDDGMDDDEEVEEDEIGSEELDFLGPLQPFSHDNCIEGNCDDNKYNNFKTAGQDFDREDIIFDYSVILDEEDEDKLIVLLLSRLPNLQTLYIVMPEVYHDDMKRNVFYQYLENTSDPSSRPLQKLETLYICNSMYLGGHGHREYDLDLRLLFPFMRLPSLRSLYTLTAYIFWPHWKKQEVDFTPLKQISNITTLCYDEAVLCPIDVISSLGMFNGLKSFRWTAAPTCFARSTDFIGIQKSLGEALAMHKDTLEELYIDIRHIDQKGEGRRRCLNDAILIGSLKEYSKLRTLAIDATSLCGHQDWTPPPLPLLDILPPNLESLTLFVKVSIDSTDEKIIGLGFDNKLWYSSLLKMIRNAPAKLRKLTVHITRDPPAWRPVWQVEENPEIPFPRSALEEAELACTKANIAFEQQIGLNVYLDAERTDGYTTIPYFLEQIKGRIPGRDF